LYQENSTLNGEAAQSAQSHQPLKTAMAGGYLQPPIAGSPQNRTSLGHIGGNAQISQICAH
jgi:hypothetical protein